MRQMFSVLVPALLVLICFQHSNAEVLDNSTISTDRIEIAQKEAAGSKITLEEILERHFEARGGKEAWDKVNTLKFTGNMITKETTYRAAAIYKRPDMCRLDFQSGRLYFIEAYDGTTPWQLNPGLGRTEIMKGKRAKEMVDTCDFEGPLVDYKKKGHKIKYLGQEEIDGRSAYVLQVSLKTGNIDTYYLDTKTYLPFIVKGSSTIQDQTVNTTVNVSEYIETGDIVIPFSYEFIVDGNPSPETLNISTIELNKDLDDELFTLPKNPADLR